MAETRPGSVFNDGVFEGVKQVFVRDDSTSVSFVKFVYEKQNGETEEVKHGVDHGNAEQFEFDYPNEYITSVEWTVGHFFTLRKLVFKTSNGRRSRTFGSTESVHPEMAITIKGHGNTSAIVGFYGRFGEGLLELKGHLGPAPTIKLDAIGGARGSVWSDEKHEHVSKIRVGRGTSFGISFIEVIYRDGNRDVSGGLRGREVSQGYIDEFDLEGDFLVSVGVYRDGIGNQDERITALEFKTYTGKHRLFGVIASSQKFSFDAYKIVRFHGRSCGSVLRSLGVFVSVPPVPKFSGHWIELEQNGAIPGPRRSSAIAQVGDHIYIFGGDISGDQPMIRDMHVYNSATKTWSTAPAKGQAPNFACVGASMVPVGSKLYLYGGQDRSGEYSGFRCFDTVTKEWRLLEDESTRRSFHSMTAIEKKIYIFGGVSSRGPLKTMAGYDTVTNLWFEVPTPGDSFAARERAGFVAVEGRLWVIFGFNQSVLDDVHFYDPATKRWTQVQTLGEKPCPRGGFATSVSGEHILLFGGEAGRDPRAVGQVFGGLYCFDTKTFEWEQLEKDREQDSPTPRGSCASTTSSLERNEGMLIFGGATGTNRICDDFFLYHI